MRNLRRNKRRLYLCQKYQDGLLNKYKEPIELYRNYLPTNNDGDLISIGILLIGSSIIASQRAPLSPGLENEQLNPIILNKVDIKG